MKRSDETWHRLLNWNLGQARLERLAEELLFDQGFAKLATNNTVSESKPNGMPIFSKDSKQWLMALHFVQGEQEFSALKIKFAVELATAAKHGAAGFVFITNQELSLRQREELHKLSGTTMVELFHLERIASILDQAHMTQVFPTFHNFNSQIISQSVDATILDFKSLHESFRECTNRFDLFHLRLHNFRGFERLALEFHPRLTVLIAENGRGKSSILDACRIALWQFIGSFDLALLDINTKITIQIADIHLAKLPNDQLMRQLPVVITSVGKVGAHGDLTWTRSLLSETPNSPTECDDKAAWLASWGRMLQKEVRNIDQPTLTLPVFAYYGTGRLWPQERLQPGLAERPRRNDSSFVRTWAYRDCLAITSSFDQFADWFQWIFTSHLESKLKMAEQPGAPEPAQSSAWMDAVQVVQQAIDCLLQETTGWHTLEYSVTENNLVLHNEQQIKMSVAQLSDGIRNMLAMVGDLAYRCAHLNPHLGREAARQATGVVMIDELELHLHPSWQQRVAEQLSNAFPNIQFIVTTHSPQVLSTVNADCIRILHQHEFSGETTVQTVSEQTRGVTSADLLARVMEVDPVPDLPETQKLSRYRTLIDLNLHSGEEGVALEKELITHFGPRHPVMRECERMIKLHALKHRVAQARTETQA
jgi:predicted ATP-binding protein involved in virulence